MSEETMKIPRLGRAPSEFNVSSGTIVSILAKKGFNIEDNSNTKLTAEMYEILMKEYNTEKQIKEKSLTIEVGTFNKARTEDSDVVAPEPEISQPKKEVVTKPEPIITKKKEETLVVVHEPEHITVEVQGPKILGKIELEDTTPKKKEKKVEPIGVSPEPTVEELQEKPVEKEEPAEIKKSEKRTRTHRTY